MELPHHILARGGAKPEEVQGLRDRDQGEGVCLGDIWDCGIREMCNGQIVIVNPGEEENRGYEGVEFKVDGEDALLKGAKLVTC